MLDKLFMQILDMSRIASIVILFVLAARLLLRRAPKVFSYALWAVVLFRLLCPVTIEAPVTVVPEITPTAQQYTLADQPISFVGAGVAAQQAVGDVLNGGIDVQHVPTTERDEQGNVEYVSARWWEVWVLFGKYLWLFGIAAMALYSVLSYRRLQRQLEEAVPLRDNVYLADSIGSPFVMGVFRPKIYLPSSLSLQEQSYILRHEQYHIRRLDHVCKGLGFVALCLHWFNPLVWLAFILAGKDMEMSCDEAVMREMEGDIRADYSASLLSLATGRRLIAGTPLAFGEGDTGSRIRNVLGWKKPKTWITALAAVLCIAVLAACIADPVHKSRGEYGSVQEYAEQKAKDTVSLYLWEKPSEIMREDPVEFPVLERRMTIHKSGQLSGLAEEGILEAWTYYWIVRPELGDTPEDALVLAGGQYVDEDGWIFLDNTRLVVALRYEDGSYDILSDEAYGDGGDFFGYHNGTQEALYDWYVREKGLDLPLCVEDWLDRIDMPEGGSLGNFPVHRYDGEGWYVYIPVSAWEFEPDTLGKLNTWTWHSAYGTESRLTVIHFTQPVEDEYTVAEKQGYAPLDESRQVWESHEGGVSSRYYICPAADGGSWRVEISWVDANITDYPYIAMEPQVLTLMAESFTLDERMGAKGESMVEFLSRLSVDDVTYFAQIDGAERLTKQEIVETIRNAMSGNAYTLDAIRGSLDNAIWCMELGINAPLADGWSGDDALYLWAGLAENEVEIHGGSNLPQEILLVENEALYQMVRTSQDTEPRGVDQEIYEKYRYEIEAYLRAKEAVVSEYGRREELTGLYLVAEEGRLGAELFCIASVGIIDPPEKAPLLLAGGAYVDSQLRIHDSNANNILVTVDGEAVGYVNWEWLEIDWNFETCETKEELKAAVLRAGVTVRELLGLNQPVYEQLSSSSLQFEADGYSREERIAWFGTVNEADGFGEVIVKDYYRIDGELMAWVSELTGTPHKGQYRLRIRHPDGSVAILPLPWSEYPVTAIPDVMDFTEDTFVYGMSFDENSYYNDGASLNHLQGTYRYTVYLAEKQVVQEIQNHKVTE